MPEQKSCRQEILRRLRRTAVESSREGRRFGGSNNLTYISETLIDAYTKVGQPEDAQEPARRA
jgi:hypothetical protein